jgi:PAS domain-containing protein
VSSSAAPAPQLFQTIDTMTEKQLDALPHGVIQLDAQGTVLKYNSYEANLAGLTRDRVIARTSSSRLRPART